MALGKIVQIVPAQDGWMAEYTQESGLVERSPVIVWYLTVDGEVGGMDWSDGDGLAPCEETDNFIRYSTEE